MDQPGQFIPTGFIIPEILETKDFRVRMLTVNDLIKDYDAVMTSIGHLKGVSGPYSGWPDNNLSLEQDLIDLGWHQKEFQKRSSFAYTVVNHDETKVLGCLYIYPSGHSDFDAEITMWVRKSSFDEGLDPVLFNSVKKWILQSWPFKNPGYPGREISWEEWYATK